MKVREMMAVLALENPDAEVVQSGSDHSYLPVRRALPRKAEDYREGGIRFLSEYYDEADKKAVDSPVIDVVLLA